MLSLLALDCGASNGRAVVGDYDGKTLKLDCFYRFPNEPVTVTGRMYWDILRLYLEMKKGISKCVKVGKTIASIGVDTWGTGFGLIGKSGELLGNPYHYRDNQTDGIFDKICSVVSQREIYEQTGALFSMHTTLFQLYSMKIDPSSLLDKASVLLPTPDLFNYFLTGEKLTEHTIASATQMYNIKSRKWSSDLIERLGIPDRLLTDIVNPGTFIGKIKSDVRDALGVGSIPVVAVAEHDTASAIASIPTGGKECAFISSGTWSIMGIESKEPLINDQTFRLNYGNEGVFGDTTALVKNINALWVLQQCKREWDTPEKTFGYDELEQYATEARPFLSIIDLYDNIFGTQGNMTGKIAEACRKTGQRIPESKGEIVRCILESIALKYRMVLDELEQIVGYSIPILAIVGGGARSALLCQFTANATGRSVVSWLSEATAAGNILCQLYAKGEIASLSEARLLIERSFPKTEYTPFNHQFWNEPYAKYLELAGKSI